MPHTQETSENQQAKQPQLDDISRIDYQEAVLVDEPASDLLSSGQQSAASIDYQEAVLGMPDGHGILPLLPATGSTAALPLAANGAASGMAASPWMLGAGLAGLAAAGAAAAAGGSKDVARDDSATHTLAQSNPDHHDMPGGKPVPTPPPALETPAPHPSPAPATPPSSEAPPPAPPASSPATPEVTDQPRAVSHNAETVLDATTFSTAANGATVRAILIQKINVFASPNSSDTSEPALMLRQENGRNAIPLAEGSLVLASDFDKLSWDSRHNAGGSFQFIAVDADSHEPLPGAMSHIVPILEHPHPPSYDAGQPQQIVAHDATLTFSAATFNGTDPDHQPDYIRISNLNPADALSGAPAALRLHHNTGADTPLQDGSIISRQDFGNIRWDSAGNNGGHFDFTPVVPDNPEKAGSADASYSPVLGATAQRVTVHESPVAPDYSAPATQTVAHDLVAAINSNLIDGSDAAHKPAAVRISQINEQNDTDTAHSALTLVQGATVTEVKTGQTISAADFDKLRWDASHNDGGSFSFTALDADNLPIEGSQSRTVTVHESPVAPDYSAPATQTVAHDLVAAINSSLLEGSDAAHKPAAVRITQVNEQNDTEADHSALTLVQGSTSTEIKAGQTISAADFDKLHWDASHNNGGSFSFTALDADNLPIEGSQSRTVTVHESPVVPDYSGSATQTIAHDQVATISSSLLDGSDAAHKPAAVRITQVNEQNDTEADHSALTLVQGSTSTEIKAGQTISAADFDKLHWDASHNNGGSFSFTALDADNLPIEGSQSRTVTVHEHPQPPHYDAGQPQQIVAHDATLTFSAATFNGTDPDHQPDYIRISNLNPADALSGAPAALRLHHNTGADTPLQDGSIISRQDFGNIRWDSAGNNGGHFDFTPVVPDNPEKAGAADASYSPVLGATAQHVTVHESPVAPDYSGSATQTVAHNQVTTIHARLFEGSDIARKPAAIRISKVNELNDTDTDHSAMTLVQGATTTEVKAGQTISAADFANLRWDSGQNDGGSFSFTALDADNLPIEGSAARTVTIHESPIPPDYTSPVTQTLPHDQSKAIDVQMFEGTNPAHKPAAVRIFHVDEKSDTDSAHSALTVVRGATTTEVKAGQIFTAADFANFRWDASHNDGGSFSLIALDARNQPIEGSAPRTIIVHESPVAPDYSAPATQAVAHDQTIEIHKRVFEGGDIAHKPAAVRISRINEQNDTDTNHSALTLMHGATATEVKAGQTISAADFDKLRWDASHNDGGSFSFTALDADGQHIEGSQSRTVTVHEHPQPPHYDAGQPQQIVAHDATLTFSAATFNGTDPDHQPDYIRISNLNPADALSGAPAALRLHHNTGADTPLQDGSIISRQDFGNIRWDSAGNNGGHFDFTPVVPDNPEKAGAADASYSPVLGATAQHVTVHESPVAPDYSGSATQTVAHDQTIEIHKRVFEGGNIAHKPAAVRISQINEQNDTDTNHSALTLQGATTTEVRTGQTISAADFDKLRWDASHNDGGSFSFTALDADNLPIEGSVPRTLTVHESPVAPDYSGAATQTVAHDQSRAIDAQVFQGANAAHQPSAVLITQVNEQNDTDTAHSALTLVQGATTTEVKAEQIISAADFAHLHWDASHNNGGSLSFIALDASNQPIKGAQLRTVTIHESPITPLYPATLAPIKAPFNQLLHFNHELTAGNTPARAPAGGIRITAIHEDGDTATSHSALGLSSGNAIQTELHVGDRVKAEDLDNLAWDASHNTGGTFSFEALDAFDIAIAGTTPQTITITEDPVAKGTPHAPVLAHDAITFIDPATFVGNASTTGRFFKIQGVESYESPTKQRVINWHENVSNIKPTAYEIIHTDHAITKTQASALAESLHGHLLSLDNDEEKGWLKLNLFDRFHETAEQYFHTGSTAQTLSGFVIEYENYEEPLRLQEGEKSEILWVGTVVGEHELSHIHWNSLLNSGGHFSFIEVEGRRVRYEGEQSNRDDPHAPGNTQKPNTTETDVALSEEGGNVHVVKSIPTSLMDDDLHHHQPWL
ncbi:MAG: hypothetical protein Q4B13_04140 [Lautropia sp.]|nr:hypothetical protein [Lautropia sp.]